MFTQVSHCGPWASGFVFAEVEKNLSAARRKDLEEEVKPARKVRPESAGEAPKPTPRSLPPRTQSAHTLMSNGRLRFFEDEILLNQDIV